MTDNYSFSNSPPYITYHVPASPNKRTGNKVQSKMVTPDIKKNPYQRKPQSYFKQARSRSHKLFTHVKLPDNMEELTPKEYKSTMIHFERQDREYVIKQQQRNKNVNQQHPYTAKCNMTEREHTYLELQAQNMVAETNRVQQQKAEARRQQLQFRWKYSRDHMDHPNPWNSQWVAHYQKMHPGKEVATPWLRTATSKRPIFLKLHLTHSFKT